MSYPHDTGRYDDYYGNPDPMHIDSERFTIPASTTTHDPEAGPQCRCDTCAWPTDTQIEIWRRDGFVWPPPTNPDHRKIEA